jgi:hypothetical protein
MNALSGRHAAAGGDAAAVATVDAVTESTAAKCTRSSCRGAPLRSKYFCAWERTSRRGDDPPTDGPME